MEKKCYISRAAAMAEGGAGNEWGFRRVEIYGWVFTVLVIAELFKWG